MPSQAEEELNKLHEAVANLLDEQAQMGGLGEGFADLLEFNQEQTRRELLRTLERASALVAEIQNAGGPSRPDLESRLENLETQVAGVGNQLASIEQQLRALRQELENLGS